MTTPIIEVTDLLKRFGTSEVLNHVSFTIQEGESVGLLGENGAGKTTTLRILAGFLPPTSGTVQVAGHDAVFDGLELRRCIGYLPENVPLYPNMRVEEYLRYRARLKGVARRQAASAVTDAIGRVDLTARRRSIIRTLSKGLRQRVGIADAIVHSPRILILDEPTSGLDPAQRVDVRRLIARLKGEHTVLVSSHILPEVESSCDRVVVLKSGTVVAEGTINELRRGSNHDHFAVTVSGDSVAIFKLLDDIPGLEYKKMSATGEGRHSFAVELASGDVDREGVARALVGAGFGLHELHAEVDSLESIFLSLTQPSTEGHS